MADIVKVDYGQTQFFSTKILHIRCEVMHYKTAEVVPGDGGSVSLNQACFTHHMQKTIMLYVYQWYIYQYINKEQRHSELKGHQFKGNSIVNTQCEPIHFPTAIQKPFHV